MDSAQCSQHSDIHHWVNSAAWSPGHPVNRLNTGTTRLECGFEGRVDCKAYAGALCLFKTNYLRTGTIYTNTVASPKRRCQKHSTSQPTAMLFNCINSHHFYLHILSLVFYLPLPNRQLSHNGPTPLSLKYHLFCSEYSLSLSYPLLIAKTIQVHHQHFFLQSVHHIPKDMTAYT